MKQLVNNIINQALPSMPASFSKELKDLVKATLAKNYKERPSITGVLASPVLRDKISNILGETAKQVIRTFSTSPLALTSALYQYRHSLERILTYSFTW
jgi:serine/threonine protein kinase